MGGPYFIHIGKNPINSKLSSGKEVRFGKDGISEPLSACEILDLRAQQPPDSPLRADSKDTERQMLSDARAEGCVKADDSEVQEVVIRPQKAKNPVETPNISEDTVASQSPPDSNPSVGELKQEQAPTEVGPNNASNLVWRQHDPMSPSSVTGLMYPAPVTDEELQAILLRLQRNEPEPGEPHPSHADPTSQFKANAGDPVDLATGAFTLRSVDLTVPTPFLPIEFVRYYRSGRPYFGPFGFGWDHAYNIYIRPLKNNDIALWTGELSEWHFNFNGAFWDSRAGIAISLERLSGAGDDGYQVRYSGGILWRFDRPTGWGDPERIPLTVISDRFGNEVRLKYDSLNRLKSVLDEDGRGLRFEYGECGLLEHVMDHTGTRRIRYEHSPDVEHLARVVFPPTAQFPDGMTYCYEYDIAQDHEAMRHNIIRVTDAYGRTSVKNKYGEPDAGWAFNCVIRQWSDDYLYRFDYEQIQFVWPNVKYVDVPATRTIVRTPDDGLHIYTFNYRGDLLDHRFRLNRDGSLRVIVTQWDYDAEGNIIETRFPDGMRELRTYDTVNPNPCARRNLLKIEMAAALPGLSPSRTVFQARYDPLYQLPISTKDELGQETKFVYDFDIAKPFPTGRLVRKEPPQVVLDNGTIQSGALNITSNNRGQTLLIETPEGIITELHYSTIGPTIHFLEKVVNDPFGVAAVTTFEYDAFGFIKAVTSPAGRTQRMHANTFGQFEELISPPIAGNSAVVRQWFDDGGGLVRIQRPRGTYDDSILAGAPIEDVFQRDALGRVVQSRLASNTARPRESIQRLDHEGRIVSSWDGNKNRTDRYFDERGLLLQEIRAVGTAEQELVRHTYDRGGLVTHTEWRGDIQLIERDIWGRPSRVTMPNGAVFSYTWTAGDRIASVQVDGHPAPGDPPRTLRKQSYEYDERGRLHRTTVWSFVDDIRTAILLTTTYDYDADDRITAIRTPRGMETRYTYDSQGRLIGVSDSLGNSQTSVFDAGGDLRTITFTEMEGGTARKLTHTFQYDTRGRISVSDDGIGITEIVQDDRDLIIERREPEGLVVRFRHGPNREIDETVRDPTGLGIRSQWRYDPAGYTRQFIDPAGESTTWDYDALGHLRRTTLSDGTVWKVTVDVKGRTITHDAPSGTRIVRSFTDSWNQLSSVSCRSGIGMHSVSPNNYEYDALGQIVRAIDGVSVIERRYDSLGRMVYETSNDAVIEFKYDDSLGTQDLIYPDGRRERTYMDSNDRVTQVTLVYPGALGGTAGDNLLQIAYGSSRRPLRLDYGNGVETRLNYDDARRLVAMDIFTSTTPIEAFRASLDSRNRRRVIQRVGGAVANNSSYLFDNIDRLTEARWGFALPNSSSVATPEKLIENSAAAESAATTADNVETYRLGPADDRLDLRRVGASPLHQIYSMAPGHRLAAVGSEVLNYDADGTRTSDANNVYELDGLGRVVAIRDPVSGKLHAKYSYDALSRRASGSENGDTFLRWFVGSIAIHETRGSANQTSQMTPNPLWRPLPLQQRDTRVHFIHADLSRSSALVTDDTGTVVERHRFGPFGSVEVFNSAGVSLAPHSAVVMPFWGGIPYLAAARCYVTPERLYDPAHGVFLSRDPLLFLDSVSPYVFASHNPVDFVDPTGLFKSPLGEAPKALTSNVPDWTTQTEWVFPDLEFGSIPMIKSYDTGNRPLNFLLNKVIFPWRNLLAASENVVFDVLGKFDKGMERLLGPDWQMLQVMLPQIRAITGAELVVANSFRYLATCFATSSKVEQVNSLAFSALTAGGISGGVKMPSASRAARIRYSSWLKEQFMEEMRKIILNDPDHPLRFLIDTTTKDWVSRTHVSHEPTIQAGHQVSRWWVWETGAIERLAVEDSFLNQWTNWRGETGTRAAFFKESVLVKGVYVEVQSLELWAEQYPALKEFLNQSRTQGW